MQQKHSDLEKIAKDFISCRGEAIQRIERTHISNIYLTEHFAYKQKKPLFFGFLDYRSVEQRENFCKKEIELNRRLSNIYIKAEPVFADDEVADWLVVMRRLKKNQMLSYYLENDNLSSNMIEAFIEKFYRFALQDVSAEIEEFGDAAVMINNWKENFEQTENQIDVTITDAQFSKIKAAAENFCLKEDLFKGRIAAGAIIDGHGDMRIEHIYFEKDQAYLFDCIEFNDRFRYQDRLLDFAFLLMDLEYNDYNKISEIMFEKYCRKFNEKKIETLCSFYKCYRAYVRGKVEGFMYDETKADENLKRAKRYFGLSALYADQF